ncbi:MAG: sulfotransferase [Phycisphaerales bacterium]|nr:sulfotransferase [Phycisphaerales bacterium]
MTDPKALAAELQSLLDRARADEATARVRAELAAEPHNHALLALAGEFFSAVGLHPDAIAALSALTSSHPDDPRFLMQLAAAQKAGGDLPGAEQSAARLLALAPGQPQALALRADLLYLQGRYREAFEFIAPAARSPNAHPGLAVTFARICRVENKAWEGISALEKALARPGLHPQLAADAGLQLAKLYDSVKRYDQAWAAAAKANALKGAKFDPDAFDTAAQSMCDAWSAQAVARLPAAARTDLPVLIVGMPRSGTTLVEQILASHPSAAAGAELPDLSRAVIRLTGPMKTDPPLLTDPSPLDAETVAREADRYLSHLRSIGPAAARVTDKMPLNALHLGLVRAIAPGARVVWCRREPLDVIASCLFQHFAGSNPFAYNPEHLARFHRTLDRVMRHWQGVLGLDILELPYEALVADQEGWTRRLLEFAGLPWDGACLRYHESERVAMTLSNDQVRQPIFTSSVERWRRYEKHLAPLRDLFDA